MHELGASAIALSVTIASVFLVFSARGNGGLQLGSYKSTREHRNLGHVVHLRGKQYLCACSEEIRIQLLEERQTECDIQDSEPPHKAVRRQRNLNWIVALGS